MFSWQSVSHLVTKRIGKVDLFKTLTLTECALIRTECHYRWFLIVSPSFKRLQPPWLTANQVPYERRPNSPPARPIDRQFPTEQLWCVLRIIQVNSTSFKSHRCPCSLALHRDVFPDCPWPLKVTTEVFLTNFDRSLSSFALIHSQSLEQLPNHSGVQRLMAFLWLIVPLLVLMDGSFGEGRHRSKWAVETLGEPSAWHSYDQKEFKMGDFDKRIIVYEN